MQHDKDKLLLSEFKKATSKNGSSPFTNLDDNFNEKFDFFIKRYEEIMEITGIHIPPHKWSYHRVGLLTKGEAFYTCGIYRFTAIKNTLIIIPARMITTSDWSAESKGYNLLFRLDFLLQNNLSYRSIENKGVLHPSVRPYLSLNDAQAQQLTEIYETILNEKDAGDPFKNELIALKIVELLILCERFYAEVLHVSRNHQTINLLKNFAALIEKHFAEERSVAFYASQLHVHPNYLNALVKANAAITAKDSIQNRVLLEAKYLLHTTNLSIKEIASNIGFDDPNYLLRSSKGLSIHPLQPIGLIMFENDRTCFDYQSLTLKEDRSFVL